jgi:hypothetical protein
MYLWHGRTLNSLPMQRRTGLGETFVVSGLPMYQIRPDLLSFLATLYPGALGVSVPTLCVWCCWLCLWLLSAWGGARLLYVFCLSNFFLVSHQEHWLSLSTWPPFTALTVTAWVPCFYLADRKIRARCLACWLQVPGHWGMPFIFPLFLF